MANPGFIFLNEVIHFDEVTHNPSTFAVSDADSTPTFAVYEEDTDTDIGVGGNFTKRTALTGNYRGSFTVSAANGFEVGKFYNVIASATVNTISAKKVVMTFMVLPAAVSAGIPKVDPSYLDGNAIQSASGYIKVSEGTGTGQLDLTSGRPGIDWAKVSNQSSSVNLSATAVQTATNVETDTQDIQSRLPAALVSGKMDSDMTAISGDTGAADNLEKEYDGTGYGHILVRTTIATLASQTSFTLTAGSADDNAYNGCIIVIENASTAAQKAVGVIGDYTGLTKTITLLNDPAIFTMATTNIVTIIADRALKPTVDNRTLDVSTGGESGVDWANVGSATTTVTLSGTTVKTATDVETDTQDIQSRLPAALVSGRMSSDAVAISGSTAAADAVEANIANLDAAVSTVNTNIAALNDLSQADIRTAVGLATANLDTQLSGIQSDLPTVITQNTALNNFEFYMVNSTDHVTGETGLTVTAERSIDGLAFAACANAVSEVGNGLYKINLAASDLNGGVITLKFTATGADARLITIVTQPT